VVAAAVVFIAAAGTALATTGFREPSAPPTHPVAAVQQVTLSPTPSASPSRGGTGVRGWTGSGTSI
jgi:hypothetical protein